MESSSTLRLENPIPTKVSNIDVKYIAEYNQNGSISKGVLYKNRHYETGALARAMISKVAPIKALHKRYRDSSLTRVYARVYADWTPIAISAKHGLQNIDLSLPSLAHEPPKVKDFSGVGLVEASRGSLIHKISVED